MGRGILVAAVVLLAAVLASAASTASGSTAGTPTAKTVVLQLRAAGLPIGKFKAYNERTDENHLLGRPGQYTSKVNFVDKRIKDGPGGFDVGSGGAVEVFASKADAKRRYDYIAALAKSPLFAEYDYLEGKGLLRLSHILLPSQAKKYETVFRRLV